jgi:hypothetical protein
MKSLATGHASMSRPTAADAKSASGPSLTGYAPSVARAGLSGGTVRGERCMCGGSRLSSWKRCGNSGVLFWLHPGP